MSDKSQTKVLNNLLRKEQNKYGEKNWTEIAQVLNTLNLSTEGNKPMRMLKNYSFIQEKDYTNPEFKFACRTEYLPRENLDWWQSLTNNGTQINFVCFKDGKMELSIPMLFETKETDQALWKQCQSKLQQSQPYSTDWNKKGELGEQFRGMINRYTKCLSKRKSDLLAKASADKQQQEVSDRNAVPNNPPINDLSAIHTDIPALPDEEEIEFDAVLENSANFATLHYLQIPAFPSELKETHTPTPQSDGNKATYCEEKLREYMLSHSHFKWDKIIELINRHKHLPDSNKNCAMSLLSNEYFMCKEDETIVRYYDLNLFPEEISWWKRKLEQENWSKFAQFDGGMLKLNIPKLFSESKSGKKEVKDRLKGALDAASSSHPFGQGYGLSIEANLNKYLKRLSKRKNDFITSVILKNSSSLKRGRQEEIIEIKNKKSLCHTLLPQQCLHQSNSDTTALPSRQQMIDLGSGNIPSTQFVQPGMQDSTDSIHYLPLIFSMVPNNYSISTTLEI